LFQLADFFKQGIGGDHYAVANQALHAFTQNAGRDKVQDGFFAINHQSMTGIVAALVTHHGGGLFGQQVNDFALAFITPLGAQHDDISSHLYSLKVDCNGGSGIGCQLPSVNSSCCVQPAARAADKSCPGSA